MKYVKSLFSLTDKEDKKSLSFLGLFMLFAAFIELLGVGSLFPYIKILNEPSLIQTNSKLHTVYQFFAFSNQNYFLIFLGFLIFTMILAKGAITCLNNYFQARFAARMNNKISSKILRTYVHMSYSDLTLTNSNTLSKHLLFDVKNVIGVISATLNMLTNIIVAMALVSLMLFADPTAVVASIVMLVAFLKLTTWLTRDRINRLGKSNELNYRKVYQTSSETFSGIKDIKTFGVENYFVDKYCSTNKILSSHQVQFNVISNLPVVVMNVVGFGVLMAVLLYLLFTKGSILHVLPIIAIIAICIQRLLPAASAISTSIGVLRQFKPVVYIVADAIRHLKDLVPVNNKAKTSPALITFQKEIRFKDISYQYPESDVNALNDVSFKISKNTSLGIIGASGAGKSTLIDVLLGLYAPVNGQIFCDDVEITQSNYADFRSLIGYVPQKTFLLDSSIKENIAFGISADDVNPEQLRKAIEVAQLATFIDQLPEDVDTMIGENGLKMSGGQRQRLGIARALYHNPEIVVLDEATNALDSITETEFNQSLKSLSRHKTLIIIAHRFSSIEFCDALLVIDKGRIVTQGSYESVISTNEFQKLYPSLITAT